jgi:hypothetical protein
MPDIPTPDRDEYEWQPCRLVLPRIAKLLNRGGLHTRLLMPGTYFFRRSRTLGCRIYRK